MKPVPLLSDSQSAIKWATKERCASARAKHTDVGVHFIRRLVSESELEVAYVRSEENGRDMLTKPLGLVLLEGIMILFGSGGVTEEQY